NGQQRRVDVSRQETLAWTLRYKLGLTGTKLGCDRAECGSCTVLIDDIPRYSCSVLTHTVRAGRVLTIEGLASADGTLHPVQRAVVDEQGFQCAFCMSGFIMSAVGFLKRRTDPMSDFKLIGKNYQTPDLVAKVMGRAKYAEDFRAEGMLFCKQLLSPESHARVRHIDARAALAMSGVAAVLTADELPIVRPDPDPTGAEESEDGSPCLTNEPVFEGEPILAVAAV